MTEKNKILQEPLPYFPFHWAYYALGKLNIHDKEDFLDALSYIMDETWRVKFNDDERLAKFRFELGRQFDEFMHKELPKQQ